MPDEIETIATFAVEAQRGDRVIERIDRIIQHYKNIRYHVDAESTKLKNVVAWHTKLAQAISSEAPASLQIPDYGQLPIDRDIAEAAMRKRLVHFGNRIEAHLTDMIQWEELFQKMADDMDKNHKSLLDGTGQKD